MPDPSFSISKLLDDLLKGPGLLDLARKTGVVSGDAGTGGVAGEPRTAGADLMGLAKDAKAAEQVLERKEPTSATLPATRTTSDLKLPSEDVDPKTGLSYERFYPSPEWSPRRWTPAVGLPRPVEPDAVVSEKPSDTVTRPKQAKAARVTSPASDTTAQVPNNPETSPQGAAPQKDVVAEQLDKRRADLENQRQALLTKADETKNLTDEEKIAYAILGALPALLGTLGGAAIAGGYGAAAGAAGGLQGAAEGMGSIAAEKKSARKEAIDQAAKLLEQQMHVEDLGAANQQRLGQQAFAAGEAEKGRQFETQQFGQKMGGQKELAALEHRNRLGEIGAQIAGQKDLKRMDIFGDLQKAEMALLAKSKEQGLDAKDYEINAARYATRMLGASPAIDGAEREMTTLAGQLATKHGWARAMSDPKTRQAAAAVYAFISGVLRKDSGAAISDKEWEDTFNQFMPTLRDDADTLRFKRAERQRETATMIGAAGKARGIITNALEAVPPEATGAPQGSTQDIWSTMKRVQ